MVEHKVRFGRHGTYRCADEHSIDHIVARNLSAGHIIVGVDSV